METAAWGLAKSGGRFKARTVGVVIAILVMITAVFFTPRSAHAADAAPYRATVFTRGYDRAAKVVTLTFDGDWSNAGFASVLATLKANNITAGFALTGRFVSTYPTDARAVVAAGHKLINHSYNHPYFSTLTQAQRWSQLDQAEAIYRQQGLSSAGWFRAPYKDAYADLTLNRDLALRHYYINFDWTYDTTGYRGASQSTILSRVKQYTVPGGDSGHAPGRRFDRSRGVARDHFDVARDGLHVHQSAAGGDDRRHQVEVRGGRRRGLAWRCTRVSRNDCYDDRHGGAVVREGTHLLDFHNGCAVCGRRHPDQVPLARHGQLTSAVPDHRRVRGNRRSGLSVPGRARLLVIRDRCAVCGRRDPTKYRSLGTVSSRLRFPTTDEYATTTGARSDFQGGSILWNRSTGATTVVYT